ncbi:hypothetical protein ODJ79_45650 [Actinoplanes sp. KI2]|uniref:hypothetical protein n=1 Tax=Actinoplanes sp. KI2 TaxID=2983315 RepID=UPI0021D5EB29|nr:hypothetical protein [Actinoplanes sp. KI2]MCU7731043.1 hypothetical protein [Actinoplanes sp. KI2]
MVDFAASRDRSDGAASELSDPGAAPARDAVGHNAPRHSAAARWHHSGALVWTWRLTGIVSAAGLLLVGAGAGLWAAFPEVTASGAPALVGFVALFVAVSGRLSTASTMRYEDVPLAQPPTFADPIHRSGRRRRSVRRQSTIAYLGMVLGGLVALPAVYWNTNPLVDNLLVLAIAAGMIAGCYLAGPAARFVVTPHHLHIDTAFRRISVPRRLIGTFSRSGLGIRLDLVDGDHIDFRVDSPLWDTRGGEYRSNERCQVRTVQRIVAMLREIPDAGNTAMTTTKLRPGMVAFAAITALVTVPVITAGGFAVFTS